MNILPLLEFVARSYEQQVHKRNVVSLPFSPSPSFETILDFYEEEIPHHAQWRQHAAMD